MAACGSLQHIFKDKPIDPPPPLFNPLSPMKSLDVLPSPTDVFSGLNISDTESSVTTENNTLTPDHHQRNVSLSSTNSESLCEALGFESFDDVEELNNDQWEQQQRHDQDQDQGRRSFGGTRKLRHAKSDISTELRRSRISGKEIPPPISSFGRRVCFKSYRYNGRLILKEVKIPTQELLHAYREDGRLKLQFVQYDDDVEIEKRNERKNGDNDCGEARQDCDEVDDNRTEKNEMKEE